MKTLSKVITDKENFVAFTLDCKSYNVTKNSPQFGAILSAVLDGNLARIRSIINVEKLIMEYSGGKLIEKNGALFFMENLIPDGLANIIKNALSESLPVSPYLRFFQNCLKSVSWEEVTGNLHDFMQNNDLPFTSDGEFLAYKLVTSNWRPPYHKTNGIAYRIGKVTKISEKERVDSSDKRICGGSGIYFGNKKYWNGSFDSSGRYIGDGKMLVAKVNPADIIALSSDQHTKCRATKLLIVGEYNKMLDFLRDEKLVTIDNGFVKKVSRKKHSPTRDNRGRFVKVSRV